MGTVHGYYKQMHGRATGVGRGVEFTRTLRGVSRGLKNFFPSTPLSRIPLLADEMREIRSVMSMDNLRDLTFWALWSAQWKGVMRSSDILRLTVEKAWRWDPAKGTYVGRFTCEDVEPEENGGCKTRMSWRLKPKKTDQGGENSFEKTFLADSDRSATSAVFAIYSLTHKMGYCDDWDHLNVPLLLDPDTGKEVTISSSRTMLAMKVREADLSPQHIKRHSLRIGGATAYENSREGGSITVVLLGLWESGAR